MAKSESMDITDDEVERVAQAIQDATKEARGVLGLLLPRINDRVRDKEEPVRSWCLAEARAAVAEWEKIKAERA